MTYVRIYHFVFGILNTIALLVAFIYALESHAIDIYFSYFTVLSNISITAVFLYFGLKGNKKGPKNGLISNIYGASVLYMLITGVVFWTILRNNHTLAPTQWINFTLHGIMPIASLIGWIIYSPKYKFIAFDSIKWLIFPLFFVLYTSVRGPIVHWYPYPFLNPDIVGYLGVAKYVVGILIGSVVIAEFLIWISDSKLKKSK